jgi:diguanylate cyclase (GGDEF)-like protein
MTSDSALSSTKSSSKVLLIDDSKLMRIAGERMLRDEFNVIVANNGQEGWEKITQDSNIHVVFSDLNMPGMSGYELLKKIRSSENEGIRNLPVVIVTGAEENDEKDGSKELSLSLGATDFITKPFQSTDLKARANAYADYQRTTTELIEQTDIDPLTGLKNRRGFYDQLAKDVSFVARHREDLAVLQIAFDQFDALLARVGKQGADSLIKEVSKVLSKCVRCEDTVARVGQSTFCLSLPTAKKEGAVGLAQRICRTVAAFNVRLKNQTISISVSAAVCSIEKGFKPPLDEIDRQLDASLKQALRQGGGGIVSGQLGDDQAVAKESFISIDRLLAQLQSGDVSEMGTVLDDAVARLKPLIALLTEEQLKTLLNDHARVDDEIVG